MSEAGAELDVACLEEFWASHVEGAMKLDEKVVKLLLDTLGLGNQQAYRKLILERPSFPEFTRWIVETAGLPDPVLVDRFHAWLYEIEPGEEAKARLAAIKHAEPVFGEAALRHWDEHGYVVLPDAIGHDEIAAVRDLVWAEVGGTPDDPDSWYRPREDGIMVARFQHPALEAARRSPRIMKAFAQLWGSENLWCTIDRMGFNPPERPGHEFAGSDLHWDVSLAQPIPFGTQAVLYLVDTSADMGAFRCVPGFHKRIDDWLDEMGPDSDPRAVDLHAGQHHVAGRAGDLVVWRQDLPHGASPNRSDRPRLAQYLNFYSPDMVIHQRWR